MKNIINFIFTTKIFIQLKDKKFLKTSWLYLAYLVAIAIATTGIVNANKFGFEYTFVDFYFFLPVLALTIIYIWKYYKPSLAWYEIPGTFSKLDYLSNLKRPLTAEEKRIRVGLNLDFKNKFGVFFSEGKHKWYNKFQPWLIFIEVILIFILFK